MIRHIVLLKIKSETSPQTVDQIERELAGLKDTIPGILSFDWGSYSSNEGLNQGFTHGFVMDFESAAARDAYLPHPEHETVKALVLENINGLEDVVAFDFEA